MNKKSSITKLKQDHALLFNFILFSIDYTDWFVIAGFALDFILYEKITHTLTDAVIF